MVSSVAAKALDLAAEVHDEALLEPVFAANVGIDVDVHEGAGRLEAVAAGPDLGEAAADGEGQVAGARDLSDEGRGHAAEPGPEPERVALGKHAFPLDRGGDGGLEALGEGDEVGRGSSGAQAEVEERAARGGQELGGPCHVVGVGPGGRGRLVGPGVEAGLVAEQVVVDGDLDEDGAGGRRPGEPAGAADGGVDLGPVRRPELGLADGPDDGGLVHVVELERPAGVAADAAPEDEQGDAVEVGLGDAGEGVGEAGARHDVHAAQAAGRPGDPVGHERCALLVGHQDGPHAVRPAERVVELQVVGAGDAERERHALILQRADDDLGAAHLSALSVFGRAQGLLLSGRAGRGRRGGRARPRGRPAP